MVGEKPKSIFYLAQYVPIAALLGVSRLLSFDARCALASSVVGWTVRWIPPFRSRVEEGLQRVYPDMPRHDRGRIAGQVGSNMGRTLTEILHNTEFATKLDRFHAKGPGLQVLHDAKATGKGALIVSGHFGQWEAIRHYLKSQDLETGAVYRPNSNPYYEPHFLSGILKGGAPIVPKGSAGTMQMVRHIRKGGFFAILADQYVQMSESIAFLGHETQTTTSPAELALKYDLPLVPAFGLRSENGKDIHIMFEDPIEHTDAVTMMTEFNKRMGTQINANPGQWYWLHRRWKGVTSLYKGG
jgi:KDO2-lipid IV(A) lauroyltransferase